MKEWVEVQEFNVIKTGDECRTIMGNDMDPSRTLRQVNSLTASAEADRALSMLMGDEVPRREFIEKNAVYTLMIN
jgi:DNA gyrase/topoisomerase IV subunit B